MVIKRGYRVHINFKARRIDESSAPVETYFAQLLDYGGNSSIVECCVSLGESNSLPNEPDNPGCGICTKNVHHLEDKGIRWLQGDNMGLTEMVGKRGGVLLYLSTQICIIDIMYLSKDGMDLLLYQTE